MLEVHPGDNIEKMCEICISYCYEIVFKFFESILSSWAQILENFLYHVPSFRVNENNSEDFLTNSCLSNCGNSVVINLLTLATLFPK